MAESNQFFYDSQVRRFIIQFIRIFSGWQVQYGESTLKTVPVMYGDPSRQAAVILKQNSENLLSTVPAMAAYITDLEYDRKRIQSPLFVDKRDVRMRYRDPDTGELTSAQGNAFSIDRIMPVPYILKMKLDIWTSNTTQKLQILEQILTLFNPSLEIQSSDNYFDWTSLTTVDLKGNSWTSRSVPMMNSDAIDINTATFEIPIWISPPSRVKKLGVIHRVVSSIYDLELDDNVDETSGFDDNLLMGQRVRVAPLDFDVLLLNNKLSLHRSPEFVRDDLPSDVQMYTADNVNITADMNEPTVDIEGLPDANVLPPLQTVQTSLPTWDLVFDMFEGKICPGISQISLLLPDEINEVTGTITQDPDNANELFFEIDTDTIPANNLTAVHAVIDPLRSGPGTGLPAATLGQRYLLVNDIGDDGNTPGNEADAWKGTGGEQLVAVADDIIEYDGTQWLVDFDAATEVGNTHYVTNLTTQIQYSWTETKWVKSYEGEYLSGTWQIII
jgi:hypothetical protein